MGSADVILAATGRSSLADAFEWIADDHPLEQGTNLQALLRALAARAGDSDTLVRAMRRVARTLAASDLDSASVLFEVNSVLPAEEFRRALTSLAARCEGKTLANVTSSTVIAAQRNDSFTIEVLCSVAGISYSELVVRVSDLPANPRSRWAPSQVRQAFEVLDALVRGTVKTDLPGAVPARALEFLPGVGLGNDGWVTVEQMRTAGVPYEVLLAQRAAGGTWLAHRNRTSGKLGPLLADRLCAQLDKRGVKYLRSTTVGGDSSPSKLSAETGADKQVGLAATRSDGQVGFIVILSSARDSGTASKNASRLRAMKRPENLPAAVVVSGPGWAGRNETADLAVEFQGNLYSDRSIGELADKIEATLQTTERT